MKAVSVHVGTLTKGQLRQTIALERTRGSSVKCPKETPYSIEVHPREHTTLGYSVQGGQLWRGGGDHVTL